MTPWAHRTVDDLDCWEDLEDHLRLPSSTVTIIAGRDGPVVTMAVRGLLGGGLRVADPRDRLRSQDRRRLHRLGLRPAAGTAERTWAWEATVPELPDDAAVAEPFSARLRALLDVSDACSRQFLAVLREGLRLEPAQLTLLLADEEDDEAYDDEVDDDAWTDDWGEVG